MELIIKRKEPLILSEEGIPFVEAQIALPKAEGEDKACRAANHFYGRIGNAIEQIAQDILLPLSRELYEKSEDARRRFTHRPFRLFCDCRMHEVTDGMLIIRCLTVRHRGRLIFEREDRELVCEDGLILPWKEKSPK